MDRRDFLKAGIAGAGLALTGTHSSAVETPGVTATEIKIGGTNALSGPASAFGLISRTNEAYFRMVNDQGGVGGRKINFIYYDDGYSPPRTVQQTRKLVEQDEVTLIFNGLGTATNIAVQQYLNQMGVPQLFVVSGADRWNDYQHFPWTMGFLPSYRAEGRVYAQYILKYDASAKIAILYQNDDLGKGFLAGVKDVLADHWDKQVVQTASYETTDPTIDSQAETLQASGANVLITAAIPKFATQTIRKVAELDWKPLHILVSLSSSIESVLKPAGLDKAVGIVTVANLKDNADPRWANDPGMEKWRAFMRKYMPGAKQTDLYSVLGYAAATTMTQVLTQCGADLSRGNIMRQAAALHDFQVPVLPPGVRINTSPTNFQPIRQMQLTRWTGDHWEPIGDLVDGN
jgi:branched-chain amino acid transport system substrate-binding protein